MKKHFVLYLMMTLLAGASLAQSGKDGAKTISAAGQILNEYTALTANATAGATSITVAASSLNAHGRFTSALAPGDLVYIIQMQGATLVGGMWWSGWGDISAYNNAGYNEMAVVLSVPNSTTINLSCPLTKSYTASGHAQVIRVPRYNALTVNNGGSITCDAWNGTTGGVVALEVDGVTTINAGGSINASAKGFRGGTKTVQNSNLGVTSYASTSSLDGAQKGEGIGGPWTEYDLLGGQYGFAAPANGGGGGNAHNAGGGGGGNGSRIWAWNGNGNPDTTTSATYKSAWDLEAANFHKNASDGGGRGGYTFSSSDQNALTVVPGNSAWGSGSDLRRNFGGKGGRPLDFNNGRLYLGGGGGSGEQGPNTNDGGSGGAGGGLIYLLTYGAVNGAGSIISNGKQGDSTAGTPAWNGHAGIDGGGGGGAGGTVYLYTWSPVSSSITITANGGKGGDQNKTKGNFATANGEAEGPGGGGGGGHIAITSGNPVKVANGGVNGVVNAAAGDNGVAEFPPNGATKGGNGNIWQSTPLFTWTVNRDSLCRGDIAKVWVTHSANEPTGNTFYWYDAAVGGNLLGTGDTLSLTGLTASTTVYCGPCPGVLRRSSPITVINYAPSGGTDAYLCNGATATLNASGGSIYHWTPSAGLSNVNIATPVVNAGATTQYFVDITNSIGCTRRDTVMVYVANVNAVTTHDTILCNGSSITLTASGGSSYHWNTGANTASLTVSPAADHNYLVTVTSTFCSDTAHVFVDVVPHPAVSLGNDTTFCSGGSVQLNAANVGASYHWQDNSSSQFLNAATTGTYAVTVTTGPACSASDNINITVLSQANAAINPILPLCANVPSVTLTAAQPGGLWSGAGFTDNTSGIFYPAVSGTGSFTVSYGIAGMCGDTAQTTVQVNANPVVALGNDTTFCSGSTLVLNAANAGSSYTWQDNSHNQTFSVNTSGTYTVTVTNAALCTATDAITVNVVTKADATINPATPLCLNAAPLTLVPVQAGGSWYGSGFANSSSGIFDPVLSGVGTHTVTYIIGGTCGDTSQINVQVNALPLVNLGHDTTFCNGSSLTLNAANSGSSYTWQDNSHNQTLLVNSSGTYSVTVTNAASCAASDAITVNVVNKADATINPATPLCLNSSPLTLVAVQAGGSWYGSGFANSTSGIFDPVLSGTGTHTVTYIIGGSCGDTAQINVQVNALPAVSLGHDTTICLGSSLLLDAANAGSSYTWQDNSHNQTLNVNSAGTYSVTVTNASSCSASDAVVVSTQAMADATINAVAPMCVNGGTVTITAAQTGGVWSGAGFTDNTSGVFHPDVSGAGNFNVSYTIAGNCGDNDQITVQVNPAPVVNLGPDTVFCTGSSVMLDAGNAGATYHWQDNSASQQLNVATAGTYSVTVTNGFNCSNTDQISVSEQSPANASITPAGPVCGNVPDLALTAAQAGGLWTGSGFTDATSGIFHPAVSGPGIHTVTYTIGGACGDTSSLTITVLSAPAAALLVTPETCSGRNDAAVDITISGGTPPFAILWSNAATTEDISALSPGTYSVNVSDSNTCVVNASVDVDASTTDCFAPHLYIPNIFSPNGDGVNDVLYPRGSGVLSMRLLIYDRWGEKVFESEDLGTGWDGSFRGQQVESDVFYYTLKAELSDGTSIKTGGNISVVR
jgi:gliding motility-associated-like protein